MVKEDNSKVVLVIVIGFLTLSLIFGNNQTLFYISLITGILSILSSKIEAYIVFLWNKIALVLGWINSRIILALVFFLFLTPIALLRKLFSKDDPLKTKADQKTVFVERNITYKKKDLENIW